MVWVPSLVQQPVRVHVEEVDRDVQERLFALLDVQERVLGGFVVCPENPDVVARRPLRLFGCLHQLLSRLLDKMRMCLAGAQAPLEVQQGAPDAFDQDLRQEMWLHDGEPIGAAARKLCKELLLLGNERCILVFFEKTTLPPYDADQELRVELQCWVWWWKWLNGVIDAVIEVHNDVAVLEGRI